jgi:filamentous hemagglutinin family protein
MRRVRLLTLLLATTALAAPALAQAPQGGNVVAGQATISQSAARTEVNQASNRAVIEWRGFDIGPNHQVDIRQPAATSFSLQRVTGADPSAIAGRLTSNGGVALVNPNGIVFHQGAQVDVASLIATASDITNQNFMAGRMAFDGRPRPGARVENRGSITVREQGLAALVGPVAANSGTVRARLGRVAIAGAEAFALDLAGDGLLSFDVTRQVGTAPSGATALATNSGVIEAEGGHVLLTARAASGLLETLVSAGGTIAAGNIVAHAPGGGVLVPGGALLDASGPQGGRVIVGADATSRVGALGALSARTTVQRGATLRADGTRGRGGQVVVHATERTAMAGTATARGTPGGAIEVSSRGAYAVDATLDAGTDGRVLLDPVELQIVQALSGSTEPAEITAATVNTTPGLLVLQAERRIRSRATVNRSVGPLTLETTNATAQAGDGISIESPLAVTGDLRLLSAGDITQAGNAGRISATTLYAASRAGAVRLDATSNAIAALDGGGAATRFEAYSSLGLAVDGAIAAPAMRIGTSGRLTLRAPLTATGDMELFGSTGIVQQAGGAALTAGRLLPEAASGAITLDGAGNRVTELGDSSAPFGLTLVNAGALNVAGSVNAFGATLTLRTTSGDLTQDPAASRLFADFLRAEAPGGAVLFDGPFNNVARVAGSARDGFTLDAGRSLTLAGEVSGARVALTTLGDLAQESGALLVTPRLAINAVGGSVFLEDPLNRIDALGDVAAGGSLALATAGTLDLAGRLVASDVVMTTGGGQVQRGGWIETPRLRVNALTGEVALGAAGNVVPELGASGAALGFALATTGALDVTGPLDAGGALRLEAESIRLAANLVAPSVTLVTRSAGIAQDAGTLATASLRAESLDTVRLEAAGNAIAAVSGRAGPLFALRTAGALQGDDIAADLVSLTAGGAITQPAGGFGIATAHLAAQAGGRVDLGAATNAIAELGRIAAPGGLVLRTAGALRLTEPIRVPGAEFTTGGDLTQLLFATLQADTLRLDVAGAAQLGSAGNAIPVLLGARSAGELRIATSGALALAGEVRAGGTATLTSTGAITQPGGFLVAPVLVARSTAAGVTLQQANLVGAAGGGAAGTWSLRNDAATTLGISGLISAPQVALTLAGGLTDTGGGALRAEALALDAGGAVSLNGAGHRVAALSGSVAALRLATGTALAVTGPLESAGELGLQASSIAFAAPTSAGGVALLVALAGDVTQAGGGTLTLGGLQVHASGAVALDGAANAVARLSGGSAGGGFALATGGPLAVGGAIAGETVTLRSGGQMTLDGAAFTAGRAVLLAAPQGIAAGVPTTLDPLDPARLPVLMLDTRRGNGLIAIPAFVQPDVPGLPASSQPTQLAAFGPAAPAAAGGAAFDIRAGGSPIFLLLDAAPSVGAVEAGRLGLLGEGGGAFLVGAVGGVAGGPAAEQVSITNPGASYVLNSCPMGVANCGQTPPPIDPPVVPPVDPPEIPPVDLPVVPPEPPIVVLPPGPGDGGGVILLPGVLLVEWVGNTLFASGALPDDPASWAAWSPAWPLRPVARVDEQPGTSPEP